MNKPFATFDSNAFRVSDIEHARHITVGDLVFEDGSIITTDERWEIDTQYTLKFITENFSLTEKSVILDYGCGLGRIAKVLIENIGCKVYGADESPTMLRLSSEYVNSSRFYTIYPTQLNSSLKFDFIYSLWVLQHSGWPRDDLNKIFDSLHESKKFLVFNENRRYVPTNEYGFANDNTNIKELIREKFGEPLSTGKLDPEIVTKKFSERTWWGVYSRRDSN
jgi:SAM-dependent methyltransferase